MTLSAEPDPDTPELDAMTKAELLAYAAAHGVPGVGSSMKKADILAAIREVIG